MTRLMHGGMRPVTRIAQLMSRVGSTPPLYNYGYMFPELAADPEMRLPDEAGIGEQLMLLGGQMLEPANDVALSEDSMIPAAYTYLGQFIDHNITFETMIGDPGQLGPNVVPLSNPGDLVKNLRRGTLDLVSIYGEPAPRDPAANGCMLLGRVSASGNRPLGKDEFNDLPRQPRSHDIHEDRAALIGDPRNDENLVIGQLHVAFLRAHNALVRQGMTFEAAQTQLRRMYQSIVLDDFLPRILDVEILNDVMTYGPRFFKPPSEQQLFMPFEFAVAAYRFGHSMVRSRYNVNVNFGDLGILGPATLELLFTLSALSGNIDPDADVDFDTLPENWIVDWSRLLPIDAGIQFSKARKIDTRLAFPLRELRDEGGLPLPQPVEAQLAVRNLLRGYWLGLPTGQAVARAMNLSPLCGDTLLGVLPPAQRGIVASGGFAERTPLWFYILSEAGDNRPMASNGNRLGPVASRIVAETFYNLTQFSEDSIMAPSRKGTWTKFRLEDVLRLGGVI